MALLRALLVIVAAIFFVQLASAGVQRRDTETASGTASGSEGFDSLVAQFNSLAESLRNHMSSLADNANFTEMFSSLRNQIDQAATQVHDSVRSATTSS